MFHNLELEPSELEGGFGEEFEFHREVGSAAPGKVKLRFNTPKIGDRSGFQELASGLDEEVFGTDDRWPVTDSTKNPYRFICHLSIDLKSADGTVQTGTASGTLISNRHVLTVGHDLKLRQSGKTFTARKITVTPGRNTSLSDQKDWAPFKSYVAGAWVSHPKWRDSFDWQFDFGLITLAEDIGKKTFASLGGKPLGYWGSSQWGFGTQLKALEPAALRDKVVNVCGYAGDRCGAGPQDSACLDKKAAGTQFIAHDKVLDPAPAAEPRLLYHRADLRQGMSGGPIWRWDKTDRFLVAVQSSEDTAADGTPVRNVGVRITKDVLTRLKAWGWRG